ncbi:uncharacterized protein LOC116251301 [Nymphaea colorata]|nr:uncharacterized protein LOC116251301 [Nymphaea colorata]
MTTGCKDPHSLRSTETLDIGNGLSLVPRLCLLLSLFRTDPCVRPVDDWKIKRSILDFLRSPSSAGVALDVSESDIEVNRCKDLKKRKRDEPVASGVLRIYDLSSLKKKIAAADDGRSEEELYEKWKAALVSRMDGMELNLEGTKFRLSVEVPASDRFESVKKSWEEFYGGNNPRGTRRRPDTLLITGIPSRWLAEPRVSSKASTLVTHTIFSVFGNIRNLNITSDDDLCKTNDTNSRIIPDLYCKIWVQFEDFEDFCNVLKVLCGRSLQKLGTRLKVNYGVTWDKDGLFQNLQHKAPGHVQQSGSSRFMPVNRPRNDVPYHYSQSMHSESESAHPRRFRD